MKYVLRKMFRPLYHYITNKNEREFAKLYDKWARYERFKEVKNVKFLNFSFDVPDLPSFIWQFKEIFVDGIYTFESNSKYPVIYDCGANIGMSCLFFKQLFPNAKIKAFEADPMIAEVLQSNLAKNEIEDVCLVKKAAWIDGDGVEFGAEGADGGSFNYPYNRVRIESVRLKDYLEEESFVDLLKIDIEGAECKVLKDCRSSISKIKNIFIEYHSWHNESQNLSEILQVLENNNFRYYIESITYKKFPFKKNINPKKMDLQLNIFGTKND